MTHWLSYPVPAYGALVAFMLGVALGGYFVQLHLAQMIAEWWQ